MSIPVSSIDTPEELGATLDQPDAHVPETPSKGHPPALYLLFFTELWERFSYYGMRGILILYLTKQLIEGGLAIDPKDAALIYGYFTGFVYFTPLIGGWLADRFLGQRMAITIGGLTMMAGQFVLFGMNNQTGMYLGLFLLILGNGFFKPNISTLVGRLYPANDPRRDAAFSIFYMGINIGAFIAPLAVGYFSDNLFATKNAAGEVVSFGYRYGFLLSGLGMLLGQIIFNAFAPKYLGEIGKNPAGKGAVSSVDSGNLARPVTKEDKQRMTVIFILTAFVIFFWAGFEQAGSSLSLYTDKFIDRRVGRFLIPTSWFQSVNPLFIVALAPLFSIFWTSKLGRRLSTPVKMGMGMILLGVGFFFMLGAVAQRNGQGDPASEANKAALLWLVMTYLLHTLGELCLSPVGLSVVTKLAHPKFASLMMGVWMLATFIANIVGGYLAAFIETMGAGTIFGSIAGFVIALGLVMIALSKPIRKMMHGVN
ncbi:MAG: MFS transporter [Sphingobacteriales bacterium]|nr:MAG: MFS transporter [Sphingobacteriales bacterium]